MSKEMIIEKLKKAFSKGNIIKFFIAAAVFFVLAVPFAEYLKLFPNTEVRPANVVPPVLGLLWGPVGALGITFGNLLLDLTQGYDAYICTTGAITNFLYAYIPYKLWYTLVVDKKDASPYLTSVKKIIKFALIILLDSLVVTALLSFIFETHFTWEGSASTYQYALLLLNNFDMAFLLGIPALIILEKFNVPYKVPSCKERMGKKPTVNYVSSIGLSLVAAAGLIWFVISSVTGGENNAIATAIMLYGGFALCFITFFRKGNYDSKQIKANILLAKKKRDEGGATTVKVPIKTKVIIAFLVLAVVFIAIIGVVTYSLTSHLEDVDRWELLYEIIGITINIIFAIAIVFLWYVESRIVIPIEVLTDSAKEFAAMSSDEGDLTPSHITVKEGDEIGSLASSFNKMMDDIATYTKNIRQVTAEKERIGAELNIATNIQASMLPCIFPAFPERGEFDIHASMTPAKEVGGDFYDFFLIGEGKLAMVMADVSGKGVPAALFMVISKTLLKNTAQSGLSPKEILEKVNEQLCENNDVQMFVTVWIGILDIATGVCTCANAGHEYPIVQRGNGEFELIKDKHGFVLAGMEGSRYKEYELKLNLGDRIFVYTDGVAEATNQHNELYGTDRLIDILNQNKTVTSKELLTAVKDDVDKFADSAPQFDDITMLAVRILPTEIDGIVYKDFEPVPSSTPILTEYVEEYLMSSGVPTKEVYKINIVLDEIFSNIAKYSQAKMSRLGIIINDDELTLRFLDDGVPYDPTESEVPDTTLSAEERSIGGLGLFMVKKTMDSVEYFHSANKNILTLKKKLTLK